MKDFENECFEGWKNDIATILKQPNNELALQL